MQTRLAMKSDDKSEPNGKTGKRLTILSIDGGGVRGVIPAKILEVLEGHLEVNFFGAHPAQKCKIFHPSHTSKKLAIPVCSVCSDLRILIPVTSILLHRAPFSCTSIAKSLKIVKL